MSENSNTPSTQKPRHGRRRLAAPVLVAGVAASALLGLSFTPTFSAFVASIQNSVNTAGTGYLTMQESSGSTVCNSTDGGSVSTNSATCSTINKYGGNLTMVPGQSTTTAITVTNTGTVDASSFTLTPGACTQSTNGSLNGSATDLCSKLDVVITAGSEGGTTIFRGTAAELASGGAVNVPAPLAPVKAGVSVPISISVTIDSSAGSSYQGLAASQPLTWTFTS